jgi:hypothetical protein
VKKGLHRLIVQLRRKIWPSPVFAESSFLPILLRRALVRWLLEHHNPDAGPYLLEVSSGIEVYSMDGVSVPRELPAERLLLPK